MHFLYLVEWNFNGYSGVERKIRSQMSVWKELGYSVKTIVIGKHSIPDRALLKQQGFDFWHIPDNRILQKLFIDQLIKQLYFVLAFAIHFFQRYHFVYYRVSTLSLALLFITRFRLVIEVNSIDSEASGGIKKMIAPVAHFYRQLLFRSASCCFFITNELKQYYAGKYTFRNDTAFVLGNGYWNSDFSAAEMKKYFDTRKLQRRSRPTLLFIGSGDDSHYWHGYDKLIALVKSLPEFDFILVGETSVRTGDFPNLEVIPKMFRDNIVAIFLRSDIGIGTLALHRKNMQEASPLKVAEYVFFGLPVITAYHDVNISSMSFNLEIPNTEENINSVTIAAIRNFVHARFGYTLTADEQASVSLRQLEKKRTDHILQLLQTK